jgi:hypothetical protein
MLPVHNNALGTYTGDPAIAGRLAAYNDAMDQLLDPWTRDLLGSIARTTDWITLPTPLGVLTLPAGFPVALYANLDRRRQRTPPRVTAAGRVVRAHRCSDRGPGLSLIGSKVSP